MLERREDGKLWPKPWTKAQPPKPARIGVWSWSLATAVATYAVGLGLNLLGERDLSPWLFWVGAVWIGAYCIHNIRRAWQNLRWLHSPPTNPTPEDWS